MLATVIFVGIKKALIKIRILIWKNTFYFHWVYKCAILCDKRAVFGNNCANKYS